MRESEPISEALLLPARASNVKRALRGMTFIDLCSGLGGFSIAGENLGMKPLGAIDTWSLAADVYRANFPDAEMLEGPINDASTRRKLGGKVGDVDVLFAGPPCQGFTQMRNGNRVQNDERVRVTHATRRAVADFNPRVFVIENVPAMLSHQRGEFSRKFQQNLAGAGAGYNVHVAVYNAASFGVPQQRRRVLIVGIRKDEAYLRFQAPTVTNLDAYFTARRRGLNYNSFSSAADAILGNLSDDRLVPVRQAFADLPDLSAGASLEDDDYPAGPLNPYVQRMRGNTKRLTHLSTPKIQEKTRRILEKLQPGQCLQDLSKAEKEKLRRRYYSAYRRLHPDLPATTLFTKIDCAYHYGEARALSVREYARLQSVPDRHQLPVAARHAYAMIGNAVPPLLVENFLESCLLTA